MSFSSLTLMAQPNTQLLGLGGVELANSRRFVELEGISTMRVQFSGNMSVQVEYSIDYGTTWAVLVPTTSYQGAGPYISEWQDITDISEAGQGYTQVLLRAVGVGPAVLTTISYVELQYR